MPTLRLVAPNPAVIHEEPSAERLGSSSSALVALAPLIEDLSPFATLRDAALLGLVRDLAFALAELIAAKRQRAVVSTPPRYEIGLERDGASLLVSVFRQGADSGVVQAERPTAIEQARATLLRGLDQIVVADGDASVERGLLMAQEQLKAAPFDREQLKACFTDVSVSSTRRARLRLGVELSLRKPMPTSSSEVSRADLHALLFRAPVSLRLGKSRKRSRPVHVFLFAEQLVSLADEVIEAQACGRALLRRADTGGASCGVQLDDRGMLMLMVGIERGASRFPATPWHDFVQAVVSFGRRLSKRVLAVDPSQNNNLRLASFRRNLRELGDRLRTQAPAGVVPASGRGTKLNGAPESYRAFAESDTAPPPAVAPQSVGKLRFSESWRADVPGIDLKSTFLLGNAILVGSTRELACIERNSGQLIWSRRTNRGVSLLTRVGLVRLSANGRLVVHDLQDGEPTFDLALQPCVGASTSGVVVNAPGLPNLLLVAEGARHLAAVDLDSHEVRWRRAVRRSAPLRLRRAGKLVVVTSGEPQLLGLDLLSGEQVWRHCGRQRYSLPVSLADGQLFAVGHAASQLKSAATLEHLDPWTGELRWRVELPRQVVVRGPARVCSDAVVLVTRDEGDRLGAMAFDRRTGELLFDQPGGLCRGRAACVVVDDLLIANSDSGELVAMSANDGKVRYRHVFAGWSAKPVTDRPYSMQPVLRSGALFLPQSEVYVLRPHDGVILGRLPVDLVPDALRVDSQCGVYVAEASGYVAAYHAQPTLTLVQPR